MNQLPIFNFDPTTGVFIGHGFADKDQLSSDWLIPYGATAEPVPDIKDGQIAVWNGAVWTIKTTPKKIEAELREEENAANTIQKSALLAQATQQISTLQDAVDLDMATDDEKVSLTAWKKYRVLLNRVDVSGDVTWPESP